MSLKMKDGRNVRYRPIPEIPEHWAKVFWAFVPERVEGQCWLWYGRLHADGYGVWKFQRKDWISSRVAYYLSVCNPADSLVCHNCNNKQCVNPSHLYLGDHSTNGVDAWKDGCNQQAVAGSRNNREDIKAIKVALAFGERNCDIARRTGNSPETISQIKRGILWRHV